MCSKGAGDCSDVVQSLVGVLASQWQLNQHLLAHPQAALLPCRIFANVCCVAVRLGSWHGARQVRGRLPGAQPAHQQKGL